MLNKNIYITPEEYERAAKNGINEKTLNARVRKYGWDKEEAINKTFFRMPKWAFELAEKNGIKKGTLYNRVYALGWDVKRAATEKPMTQEQVKENIVKANTKYPKEYIELAQKNGIGPDLFRKRVRRGFTYEEAATKEPKKNKYPKEYVERALANGVSISAFYERLRSNRCTLEEATQPSLANKEKKTKTVKNKECNARGKVLEKKRVSADYRKRYYLFTDESAEEIQMDFPTFKIDDFIVYWDEGKTIEWICKKLKLKPIEAALICMDLDYRGVLSERAGGFLGGIK